jgi:hypothetical protein
MIGPTSALRAHGVKYRNFVAHSADRIDHWKRPPPTAQIQSREQYMDTATSKRICDFDKPFIEEMGLVHTYHFGVVAGELQHLKRSRNGRGGICQAAVTDDLRLAVTAFDRGLHGQNACDIR